MPSSIRRETSVVYPAAQGPITTTTAGSSGHATSTRPHRLLHRRLPDATASATLLDFQNHYRHVILRSASVRLQCLIQYLPSHRLGTFLPDGIDTFHTRVSTQ